MDCGRECFLINIFSALPSPPHRGRGAGASSAPGPAEFSSPILQEICINNVFCSVGNFPMGGSAQGHGSPSGPRGGGRGGGVGGLSSPSINSISGMSQKSGASDSSTQCRALYDYTSLSHTELSFRAGDVMSVVSKGGGGGWWDCLLNGQRGWVPVNYVVEI